MSGLASFCLCLLVSGVSGGPMLHNQQALEFMQRFGYLEATGGNVAQPLISAKKFQDAIRQLQRFGRIPQTGELDQQTLQLMSKKRCGVPDIRSSKGMEDEMMMGENVIRPNRRQYDGHKNSSRHLENDTLKRRKRFTLASRGLNKNHLTYKLANVPPGLGRTEVESTLIEALRAWERVGILRFSPSAASQEPDILFSFFRREHGDGFAFDGLGNVLAHAFFPGSYYYQGHVHFDGDEQWNMNNEAVLQGVDLYTVALHELGHALGLAHSSHEDSIMNPYYKTTSKELGYDDIQAMHRLYGGGRMEGDSECCPRPRYPTRPRSDSPRTTEYPKTAEYPKTTPRSTARHRVETTPKIRVQGSWSGKRPTEGCLGSFDAVALLRNELFITKDKLLWRLKGPGKVQENYPVDFHRLFNKLPRSVDKIDAMYEREKDSKILIFTGREYRVFDGTEFEGNPRPITDFGLADYVRSVDAVTSRNNTSIIFTGDRYWLFDELKMELIEDSPRSVQDWGLSGPIDSAPTFKDGVTYFFKGDIYWYYDEERKIAANPKPWSYASDFWLGC